MEKRLFEKVGYFDIDFPVCEDYEFWLRVTSSCPVLLLDKKLTLKEGGHDDQVSKIYLGRMDKFRIAGIVKLLDSSALDEKQRSLAIQALKKKCKIYGAGCAKRGRLEEAEYYQNLVDKY